MSSSGAPKITELIAAGQRGDRTAQDQLFALVYDELRGIAARSRFVGKPGDTMQATVLVNEAYLAFSRRFERGGSVVQPGDRTLFFTTVALAMRTILRDYWRQRTAQKRGGDAQQVALEDWDAVTSDSRLDNVDFLALDDALSRLEEYNRRWHDVVMHRYFGGRSVEETASLLDIGVTTVKADWRLSRAWLRREIGEPL